MKKQNQIHSMLIDHEKIKKSSNFLRGTIKENLDNTITGGFSNENFYLIRFHGIYQQDDRDIRIERKLQKLEPLINMMIRLRLPGGKITPIQWIGINQIVSNYTIYQKIRLTSRQTIQIHGIFKKNLRNVYKKLHSLKLDTIATAGDTNRNITCSSIPHIHPALHKNIINLIKKLSSHFLPKSNAYYEIWLNKKQIHKKIEFQEPVLGDTYLPKKFKICIVVPPYNDVDLHANDLVFIAITNKSNSKLTGFNVLVGGGLGMTPNNTQTYPRKASILGFIKKSNIFKIAETIILIQRDFGNRTNRHNSKTKYTIDKIGIDKFKEEIEKRSNVIFFDSKKYFLTNRIDNIGWTKNTNNLWNLILFIKNGCIYDDSQNNTKNGINEIAKIHNKPFYLTSNHNIIISDISNNNKTQIEFLIKKFNLIDNNINTIHNQYISSMACVSFPTCPLAKAEGERFLPDFTNKIHIILLNYGLLQENIILRISGCSNGCSRPLLSEIGLIGRNIGKYDLYLGGNRAGTRFALLYRENLTEYEILKIIKFTIYKWSKEKIKNESYGDYIIRNNIINT